jgi:phosphosulfolactate synthase (CoM biosynthesis protein A)
MQRSGRLVDEILEAAREGKPRENGITIASDPLDSIDRGLLEQSADYIDFVKIGLSLPLMVERSWLVERIHHYHDLGIKVMSGGTLIEVAAQKGLIAQVLGGLGELEFDVVEVSELAGALSFETKQMIASKASDLSMEWVYEVGRMDKPLMSAGDAVAKIKEALELKSHRAIVKVPKVGIGAGRGDAQGQGTWDVLNVVAGTFGPPNLIFETQEMQQLSVLVLEFGPTVNLAGVPLNEALVLEMQRLGLTVETLGLSRPLPSFEGSPAVKFIYHLIRTEHPIDQATLCLRSGLPRRTVQAALSTLVEGGLVREVPDASDLRRRRYTMR